MKKQLLFFAPVRWSPRNIMRHHHFASALAGAYDLGYIDPVRSFVGKKAAAETAPPFVVRLPGLLPFSRRFPAINTLNYKRAAALALEKSGFSAEGGILWLTEPYQLPLADILKPSLLVYDCADKFALLYGGSRRAGEMDAALMKRADILFVSSLALYDESAGLSGNLHYISNGCDYEKFAAAGTGNPGNKKAVIGFVGALGSWVDAELIRGAARSFPDALIRLVGANFQGRAYAGVPNIELTGPLEYEKLPGIIKNFDVCILPFRKEPLTRYVNPVKLYEYLASGRPVVSTDFTDFGGASGLIGRASGPLAFAAALEAAMKDKDKEAAQKRMEYASRYDWKLLSSRVAEILIGGKTL